MQDRYMVPAKPFVEMKLSRQKALRFMNEEVNSTEHNLRIK